MTGPHRPWHSFTDARYRIDHLEPFLRPSGQEALNRCVLYLKLLPLAVLTAPLLAVFFAASHSPGHLLSTLIGALLTSTLLTASNALIAKASARTMDHLSAVQFVNDHPFALQTIAAAGVMMGATDLMFITVDIQRTVLVTMPAMMVAVALGHILRPLMYFLSLTPPRTRKPSQALRTANVMNTGVFAPRPTS